MPTAARTHKKKRYYEHDRPSAAARGYGWRWRKVSKRFLRANPLCAECDRHNKVRAAEVVDHIVPHRGDKKLFWDKGNWQSLCVPCHNAKSARERML
jgi:5-methylcytosine-specific restriction protein A